MATPPHIFQSRNELIIHLKSEKTKRKANEYFSQRFPDISSVVHNSIAGNTFRSFQRMPERPSIVFRNWASNHLYNTFDAVKNVADCESYADYVHKSAFHLCRVWSLKMKADMGYGRSVKLINLVLKGLPCIEGIDRSTRKKLIHFQHVPLDSFTMVGLRQLIRKPEIPRNATMGFIKRRSDYILIQNYIADVAKEAGVPAIYYDLLAWNMAH